ncbi:LAETG motif-containing sortase-dependent surface protein [Kitasatospora sp. NPDC051853]|uniref:LAETG motif-containing sortase-dependent surface protein n=1 Tax=Kitasatospora sp. NPDC051853 TaxID=3364058 RepID=UPI0037A1858B
MRASVINRFAKIAPLSVATLLLTSGITLITADTAWACGPSPVPPMYEGPRHATEPVQAFIPELPRTITAGGAKVEVGIELFNGTGSAYQQITPGFGLLAPQPAGGRQALRAQDITVEAMVGGVWKTLPTRYDCGGAFYTDTAALKGPLDTGHAKRFMFRVGLKSSTPATQGSILLHTTDQPATLKVVHPGAAPAPAAPKPIPSTAKAAAPTAPAAPTEAPKATPSTASTPAAIPAAELASTGPKTPTAPLAGAAAALLALGAGVLFLARRRTAR